MPTYPGAENRNNLLLQIKNSLTKDDNASFLTSFGEQSVAFNTVQVGWNFPYNINPSKIRIIELNGGTVSHADNYAEVSTGVNPAGVAVVRTEGHMSYTPGVGAIFRCTAIFGTPQEESIQLIGVGDSNDGWFFGYNGLQFGIMRRSRGVDNWIYKNSWNVDTKINLDMQKGNVYQIKFQWLGYGMQYFAIENELGSITDVHRIEYANLYTDSSIDVPSLPITMGVANSGSTTNVSMKSPSAVAMSQGEAYPIGFTIPIGYSNIKSVSTGANYLFTILNPDDYQGKDNKLYIEPALLTLTNETNKAITFSVLFNTILTSPVFVDIDSDVTPAKVDESALSITNGIELATFTVPASNGRDFDLTSILAGEKIWAGSSISLICQAQASGDVTVGLTFRSRI